MLLAVDIGRVEGNGMSLIGCSVHDIEGSVVGRIEHVEEESNGHHTVMMQVTKDMIEKVTKNVPQYGMSVRVGSKTLEELRD